MSNAEGSGAQPERVVFQRLERAVGAALERMEAYRLRAESAEGRSEELEELLRRFTRDGGEAGRLLSRLHGLEAENADLRGRLDRGREGVERLLARIRFLEEQR